MNNKSVLIINIVCFILALYVLGNIILNGFPLLVCLLAIIIGIYVIFIWPFDEKSSKYLKHKLHVLTYQRNQRKEELTKLLDDVKKRNKKIDSLGNEINDLENRLGLK